VGDHVRDPEWRPLAADEAEVGEGSPRSGLDYFHSASEETPGYYWRKTPRQE
jgi:hypothetical protein